MPTGSDMAFEAFAVAKTLTLFIPCFLLVTAAFILMKGREAGTARSCVVIFTGALVVGGFLANFWLFISMGHPEYPHTEPWVTYAGATITGPLLRRIAWIMGGLAGHALIYLVWALRQLEPLRRNRIAVWLLIPAISIALYSPIPQVRFWRRIYNPETMRAAREWHDRTRSRTELVTAAWATQSGSEWQALLIRANHLYDAGRIDEAEKLDRQILQLSADKLPDGLREFVRQRLESSTPIR